MAGRSALPVIPGTSGLKCRVGDAVITSGGNLMAGHCIGAVGPNYAHYQGGVTGWIENADEVSPRALFDQRALINQRIEFVDDVDLFDSTSLYKTKSMI